jgi:hypothetical protein
MRLVQFQLCFRLRPTRGACAISDSEVATLRGRLGESDKKRSRLAISGPPASARRNRRRSGSRSDKASQPIAPRSSKLVTFRCRAMGDNEGILGWRGPERLRLVILYNKRRAEDYMVIAADEGGG